jgi:hypothetical protein
MYASRTRKVKTDRRDARALAKPVATQPTGLPIEPRTDSASFVATLDRVERFQRAQQVQAYLGLVLREMSSGEKQLKGRITKSGNKRTRYLLVEAGWGVLRTRFAPGRRPMSPARFARLGRAPAQLPVPKAAGRGAFRFAWWCRPPKVQSATAAESVARLSTLRSTSWALAAVLQGIVHVPSLAVVPPAPWSTSTTVRSRIKIRPTCCPALAAASQPSAPSGSEFIFALAS